jgi:predicted Zn-dependent protease
MTHNRPHLLFSVVLAFSLNLAACEVSSDPSQSGGSGQPPQQAQSHEFETAPLPGEQAQRLQRIMAPLIAKMDNPLPANQVKMTLIADNSINAANGGGGDFYVTRGLLAKANDDQLRGVLAHEIAHADLGHVAHQQKLGLGLELGSILLDQIFPGSGQFTPIAGQLIASNYSRKEEYEADSHGVELLRRAGLDGKRIVADTLSWIAQQSGGGSGGGFFATHPATGDRIETVQRMK